MKEGKLLSQTGNCRKTSFVVVWGDASKQKHRGRKAQRGQSIHLRVVCVDSLGQREMG